MNLNSEIYERVGELGIIEKLEKNHYIRLQREGLMDLHIDKLTDNGTTLIFSMAHNGIQNGDVMADPDMEIAYNRTARMASALSFQNDYIGMYTNAEKPEDAYSMNDFLNGWLKEIKNNNYEIVQIE